MSTVKMHQFIRVYWLSGNVVMVMVAVGSGCCACEWLL